MKQKLAIIGAGNMARIIANAASRIGVETHCFAWEAGAVAKDSVDVFHPLSIFEKDEISRICRQEGVSGVVATTELTVAIAGYVARAIGAPSNPEDISENITDKSWVRGKLSHGKYMKQPVFEYLSAGETKTTTALPFPVIVKPVSQGGKRGITVANNETELQQALTYAVEADKSNQGVLVEQYLYGGTEYSVESLSFDGNHQVIQVTEKISSGPPHCVELGHSQPARLVPALRQQVEQAIVELLQATGWKNGATHIEIKIIDGTIYLIELNARPGGDHIAWPLTQLSTGYDYIGELVKAAIGEAPAVKDATTVDRHAGVRFITKQTQELKDLFDHCDNEPWLYEKHVESEELISLEHNDGCHVNYFIYLSDTRPDF